MFVETQSSQGGMFNTMKIWTFQCKLGLQMTKIRQNQLFERILWILLRSPKVSPKAFTPKHLYNKPTQPANSPTLSNSTLLSAIHCLHCAQFCTVHCFHIDQVQIFDIFRGTGGRLIVVESDSCEGGTPDLSTRLSITLEAAQTLAGNDDDRWG